MENILKSNSKILKNMSWMLIARIINIISGVVVSIIVTRYLGVEQKGVMANVTAIAAFFSFLSSFGLNDILIKEFAGNKDRSKETALSAVCLLAFGGCLSFAFALGLAGALRVDAYTFKLVGIYSTMYLFQFLKVFEYWFYSQAESKAFTISQLIVHIVCLLLRALGIFLKMDLIWFIFCVLADSIFTSLMLLLCYKLVKTKMQGRWKVSSEMIGNLLKYCLPIIITGFAQSIYTKVDQIMVGKMMTDSDLGIYSVGVNLAEYWYFIPGVIYMSFLPVLTQEHSNRADFIIVLQEFADVLMGLGYLAVIGILIFGNFLVSLLYGPEFEQAAYILMIYIWSGIFTCLSFVGQAYYIINGNTKILMYFHCIGALLNLVLNFIFIPIMGIYGAAVATCLEYAIVAFGQMILLYKRHKNLYSIEIRAFMPFARLLKLFISILKRNLKSEEL